MTRRRAPLARRLMRVTTVRLLTRAGRCPSPYPLHPDTELAPNRGPNQVKLRYRMGASETEQRPLAAPSAEADNSDAMPTAAKPLHGRARNRIAAGAVIFGVGVLVLWLVLRDTNDH